MTLLHKDIHCNAIVYTKNGQRIEILANQLFDKNLHRWQGWHCNVGVDSIFIDDDFSVYAGNCKNDKLGNLFSEDFALFVNPTICKRTTCSSCTNDLYSTKFKEP